jgi:aquaporin related protein
MESFQTAFLLMFLGAVQSSSLVGLLRQGGEQGALITAPTLERIIYISLAAGLALLTASWMFFRLSGGLFNPAVILASLIIGAISFRRFVLYFLAQIVGGIAAAALVRALMPGPLIYTTRLGYVNRAQGVFVEAFATAILVLTILMLAAERHRATSIAPIGIAMTYLVLHLWALPLTGASMNPARSFGPAILEGFDNAHWIFWVGPFVGSLMAVAFYSWLEYIRYWMLHPTYNAEPLMTPNDYVANPAGEAAPLVSHGTRGDTRGDIHGDTHGEKGARLEEGIATDDLRRDHS